MKLIVWLTKRKWTKRRTGKRKRHNLEKINSKLLCSSLMIRTVKASTMQINYTIIRATIQQAIDYLVVDKDTNSATLKLVDADEIITDLIDHAETDEDIIEISRYKVLLNQLHQKINEVKNRSYDKDDKNSDEENYLC